ncbi:MAG: hypothetical protein ABIU97_06655 [Dehalococcoidia bacterium]
MNIAYFAQPLCAAFLTALLIGCSDDVNEAPEVPDSNDVGHSDKRGEWRLVITRVDGRIEVVDSLDQPIVCGSQEDPKIVFFCGTGFVEGQSMPVAWDFLPVNLDAGETYTIEGPATPRRAEDSVTPTVIPR